jgi:hypothetical protein
MKTNGRGKSVLFLLSYTTAREVPGLEPGSPIFVNDPGLAPDRLYAAPLVRSERV